MPGIQEALLVYGPLGIMTLLGLYATRKLFRILSDERKEHQDEIKQITSTYAADIKKLNEDHQRELGAAQELRVSEAKEWTAQYHELAKSLNSVLETLLKRIRREE